MYAHVPVCIPTDECVSMCMPVSSPKEFQVTWETTPNLTQFKIKKKKIEQGFPDCSAGKESACNARDPGLIPGSGRASGKGIGNPLQYFWTSLVAQPVKNPVEMQETWV